MHAFKTYHPIVNFFYFTAVIAFSMVLMHPACLAVSLTAGLAYSILLRRRHALRLHLLLLVPMLLTAALMNPIFNHEGVTILTYLPGGNPLTLESILYGIAAAVMLVTVLCWFSCYNEVMTSDKFIYLFGKLLPAMSLLLSMALRFVPRLRTQMRIVSDAQRCIGRDVSQGKLLARAHRGLTILSILITWSLENAIETADSMKSRGYGLPGRSAFSVFVFDRRDRRALLFMVLMSIYVLIGCGMGQLHIRYFPSVRMGGTNIYGISIVVSYFLLCIMPVAIEIWEEQRWKAIKSKI